MAKLQANLICIKLVWNQQFLKEMTILKHFRFSTSIFVIFKGKFKACFSWETVSPFQMNHGRLWRRRLGQEESLGGDCPSPLPTVCSPPPPPPPPSAQTNPHSSCSAPNYHQHSSKGHSSGRWMVWAWSSCNSTVKHNLLFRQLWAAPSNV